MGSATSEDDVFCLGFTLRSTSTSFSCLSTGAVMAPGEGWALISFLAGGSDIEIVDKCKGGHCGGRGIYMLHVSRRRH